MIAYASRTGTRRNLDALRAAGWRLLVSAGAPERGWRSEGFAYALDNGAWTAFQQGKPFDGHAFERCYARLGEGADFVIIPDIVAGGLRSLAFSLIWLARIRHPLRLLAVQDGMTTGLVEPLLGPGIGIFLGGSTDWKLDSMRSWGELARRTRSYFHVGRVNSRRRIRLCKNAGAHSFDGTSCSRFAENVPRLTPEVDQLGLFEGGGYD